MDIRYQDIITLDDKNEYVVAGKVSFQNGEYLYLVDINNNQNIKFAEIAKEGYILEINVAKESDLVQKLVPLFYEQSKVDVKDVLNYNKYTVNAEKNE